MKARTLTQMHRHATTYEVVAETPAGTLRLGFTMRPSASTFLKMARAHSEALLPHLTDDDRTSYARKTGLVLGAKVRIRTTGRTEREVAQAERA